MSPPISRSPRSVVNGCVAGQAAAREELSLPTELKTESAAALYPLLQLLGQLLNVPWVYLELVQPGSHSDSPAKGILYPNPQQIPGNEPPNPIGGSWPFQEAFPLLDEGGGWQHFTCWGSAPAN